MGIQAQAVVSGIDLLQLGLTGQNAATRAVYDETYNATYAAVATRQAAGNAKNAAERNISAIRQDKVLTDVSISMQQNQAEAAAIVSAAAAGVEGGSVDETVYETQKNESLRVAESRRASAQSIDSQLAAINGSQRTLLAAEPRVTRPSITGNLLDAFSSLSEGDVKELGNITKKIGSPLKLFSRG